MDLPIFIFIFIERKAISYNSIIAFLSIFFSVIYKVLEGNKK